MPRKDKRSAAISTRQLRRYESIIPPFVIVAGLIVLGLTENRILVGILLVPYFAGNVLISQLRYRAPRRAGPLEAIRFSLNLPLLGVILYAAGPYCPAWLLFFPGALWAPVALRRKRYMAVLLVSILLLPLVMVWWRHPDPGVVDFALPLFTLGLMCAVPIALRQVVAASERALAERILSSVENVVFTTDLEGRIQYINHAVPPLTTDQVIGRSIMDFTAAADQVRVWSFFESVRRTGVPVVYESDPAASPSNRHYQVHLSPLMADDQVHSLVFSLTDVTGQKALEADLRRARDEAERLARAKTDFLAIVNHEVRTPVNALLAGLKLLEKALPRLSPEERELLLVMQRSGAHLNGHVQSLLDMSRFAHQKEAVNSDFFVLRQLCEDLVAMYRLQVRRSIHLELEVAADLPTCVRSDAQRWETILSNLLSNAIKFTDEGRVRVTVAWADPRERRLISIRVSDTGIGFSGADRELVFEPFTQLKYDKRPPQTGVGLGLSICAANVDLLGGSISVESEVGRGTTFGLMLPVEECAAGPTSEPCADCPRLRTRADARPESVENRRERLSALRLLIVEDDDVNRIVLEKLLRREGAQMIECVDRGEHALVMAEGSRIDTILLDMHLQGESGVDVARELRARGWEGRLVAVTADTTPAMRALVDEAGIDALSPKPVDMQHLLGAILATGERH